MLGSQDPPVGDVALAVLASSPDAFVLLDRELVVRTWNPAAERLLGWPAADVLGRPDPSLPDEGHHDQAAALRRLFLDPAPGDAVVVERQRVDGRPVRVVLRGSLRLGPPADPTHVGLFLAPASPDDERLSRRNALSRDLVSAVSEEDVVATVTSAVLALTGAVDGVVLAVCPSGKHLHGHRAVGSLQEQAEALELDLAAPGPWRVALRGDVGRGLLPVGDDALPSLFLPMGPAGSGWVLALRYRGEPPTAPDLVSMAGAVADEAWMGFQRAQLVSELGGKIEILEATAAVASSAGLDLARTLSAVARAAATALSCERVGIYLRNDEDEPVLAELHATDLDITTEAGARTAREALERRELVLVQDARTCDFLDGPWHATEGAVAVMVMPLSLADREVGALVVAHTDAHPRGFTNLSQQVGTAVAQQAALAIEHARLFEAEHASVQRLTELDQLKRDYISGLTHDLKTPLAGLIGFVETLRRLGDDSTEEQRQRFLDVMQRQAARLVLLVEDLLLAARAEDGTVTPRDLRPVDVGALVAEAVESYEPDRRARLDHRPGSGPCRVLGDRAELQRVVHNLLDNALKYSEPDTTVTIEVAGTDDVVVRVRDRGAGIPAADREQVFQRFGRSATGREAGSTGLGLFITRGIARGHGGDVTIEDPTDGVGTDVVVRLPCRPTEGDV
ncbi:MAG: PAS domain-containing protein [Actinobacteria bacterium]|nr:PAS domain-containing protein [Actinomycetota bacterium]